MVKRILSIALGVMLILSSMSVFAAGAANHSQWSVVAATGMEGQVSTFKSGSSTAVSGGNIAFFNPDGNSFAWHGEIESDDIKSNTYAVTLKTGVNNDWEGKNQDLVTVFRSDGEKLVSPHFFTENCRYRISFDAKATEANNLHTGQDVSLNLYTCFTVGGFARYDWGFSNIQFQPIGSETIKVGGGYQRLTYEFAQTAPRDDYGLKIAFTFPGGKPATGNVSIWFDNFVIEKAESVAPLAQKDNMQTLGGADISVNPYTMGDQWYAGGQYADNNGNNSHFAQKADKEGADPYSYFTIKSQNHFNFTEADYGKILTLKFDIAPFNFKTKFADDTPTTADDRKVNIIVTPQYSAHPQGWVQSYSNAGEICTAQGYTTTAVNDSLRFTDVSYSMLITPEVKNMDQIEVRIPMGQFRNKHGEENVLNNNMLKYILDNIRIYKHDGLKIQDVDDRLMVYKAQEAANLPDKEFMGASYKDDVLTSVFTPVYNKGFVWPQETTKLKIFMFDDMSTLRPLIGALSKSF